MSTLRTFQDLLNLKCGTVGWLVQDCLVLLARQTGRVSATWQGTAQEAANVYANTSGLSIQNALNSKAGTVGWQLQDIAAIL